MNLEQILKKSPDVPGLWGRKVGYVFYGLYLVDFVP